MKFAYTANKALHRTATPLRSIAAGELFRYVQKEERCFIT
ncbi:hypothetical protein D1BOALGB6SA_3109 [Olavius sp. associated proteobacterium Delta 1]|nr:hypothetical protein D1BOALGB6SA_3109 [Olavius sp. associated proteobacterium Delta 1]